MITQRRYDELEDRIKGHLMALNETAISRDTDKNMTDAFWDEVFDLSEDILYELKKLVRKEERTP